LAHLDTHASTASGPDPLLDSDEFGHAEWAYVRKGATAFVLGTVLPVGGFYVVYQLWGFQLAVCVVLAWALSVLAVHHWRFRTIDIFSLTTAVLACFKAGAGVGGRFSQCTRSAFTDSTRGDAQRLLPAG
jgi:hypothetical protein